MRETEILVEQQTPKGVLVCDHAGRVINKLSLSVSCLATAARATIDETGESRIRREPANRSARPMQPPTASGLHEEKLPVRPTPSAGASDGACVVPMIGISLTKSEIGKSREGSHPIHPLLPQARRGEKLQVQPNPSIVPTDNACAALPRGTT